MRWERSPGRTVRQKNRSMTPEAVRDAWNEICDFTDATKPASIQGTHHTHCYSSLGHLSLVSANAHTHCVDEESLQTLVEVLSGVEDERGIGANPTGASNPVRTSSTLLHLSILKSPEMCSSGTWGCVFVRFGRMCLSSEWVPSE